MMLAATPLGERIQASPGAKALCPTCQSDVIAKCGEVNVWHWAHRSLKECDVWSEPESEWHYNWKVLAGLENSEIVMSNAAGEVHRADIKIDGRIIELQHSALSPREVRDRERFYGNLIWVIDADNIGEFEFAKWRSAKEKEYYAIRNIKRAWIMAITKPLYFHFSCLYFNHISHWEETRFGWRRAVDKMESEVYADVLVKWTNQKFATIISKERFCQQYFLRGVR